MFIKALIHSKKLEASFHSNKTDLSSCIRHQRRKCYTAIKKSCCKRTLDVRERCSPYTVKWTHIKQKQMVNYSIILFKNHTHTRTHLNLTKVLKQHIFQGVDSGSLQVPDYVCLYFLVFLKLACIRFLIIIGELWNRRGGQQFWW